MALDVEGVVDGGMSAVDDEGEVLDMLVQKRRNQVAA